MKSVHRKVYRYGVVRFSQMLYTGECLKNYEGHNVILLLDPDRILEMRTYESTNNDSLGEFLGYIKMINSEELGLRACLRSHWKTFQLRQNQRLRRYA